MAGKKATKAHKGGDHKLGLVSVETQFDAKNFSGWTPAELATLKAAELGDIRPFAEVLCGRLEKAGAEVDSCYAISHGKDRYTVEDFLKNPACAPGVAKTLHGHIVAHCPSREEGLTLENAAKAIGIAPNMVEKPKQGRYSFDDELAYHIHAKDPEKYQYLPSEVVTVRGPDYEEIAAYRHDAWARGAAIKARKKLSQDIDWLVERCRRGELTMENICLSNELFDVYSLSAKNQSEVEKALSAAESRKMVLAARALKAHEFSTSILFVEGPSGSGKSAFVRALVCFLEDAYHWTCDSLAAGNSLDDYHGGEIMLMDDVRGGAMSAEDWLRLLNPFDAQPGSARYKNKPALAPRVIIITSTKSVLQFFYFAKGIGGGDRSEAIDQFFRRILWNVNVLDPYDFGYYNFRLLSPRRGNAYHAYVESGRDNNGSTCYDRLDGLRWSLADDSVIYSPYGAVERLVRSIDETSAKSELGRSGKLDAAASDAQHRVKEAYAPAAEAGGLPELPGPDEGYVDHVSYEFEEAKLHIYPNSANSLAYATILVPRPERWGLPGGPKLPRAIPCPKKVPIGLLPERCVMEMPAISENVK